MAARPSYPASGREVAPSGEIASIGGGIAVVVLIGVVRPRVGLVLMTHGPEGVEEPRAVERQLARVVVQAKGEPGQGAVIGVVDQGQSRDPARRDVLDRGLDGDPLLEIVRVRGCERARREQGGGETSTPARLPKSPFAKAPSHLRSYLAA